MPNQRKYPLELRERATRMVLDALESDPDSKRGLYRRIGDQLGVNSETLRSWVKQSQIDAGDRPGTTTVESMRISELEREVRELRRANQILKSASAFFAAELDRPSR
ncbi:transposase [Brevibacterium casei]|uniref:Transposase n=1 Tax=Brevibacterium casei CIP 102111 TaxID=1255625 RepID=A0A2H1KH31_9MICO|nr:transposase [Brevibacterium casei]MCT1446467.1 transposase [Brevibacterium casei]QPR37941.1 transposase [Brevibacterium casei]QPR45232.1 transposase [Brevibacterium casei]SMX98884.1 transposase [Brevibacterium casei CIP 102111]